MNTTSVAATEPQSVRGSLVQSCAHPARGHCGHPRFLCGDTEAHRGCGWYEVAVGTDLGLQM